MSTVNSNAINKILLIIIAHLGVFLVFMTCLVGVTQYMDPGWARDTITVIGFIISLLLLTSSCAGIVKRITERGV